MKKKVSKSLKFRLFSIVGIIFAALAISNMYIIFITSRLQQISNQRFYQERYLKILQDDMIFFHETTLSYLSNKSSTALAKMLIDSQTIRAKIAHIPEKSFNTIDLYEREIYSLISHYLDMADSVIQAKRARNITQYTTEYEAMNKLLTYITSEIDSSSLQRFRQQMVDYEIYLNEYRMLQLWNLIFILTISLFSLSVIITSINNMLSPLTNLTLTSAEISQGNFDAPDIPLSSIYEIDKLVQIFNLMKNDISLYVKEIEWKRGVEQDYLKERVQNLKMQQLMKRMELYTMQAQMNPHFLFNTLNTGVQLAIVEGADKTADYMEQLAKLFRRNISQKEIIVRLRHEIESLQAYFYILRLRFPKNLLLELIVPEDLLDVCTTPVSILQPLVENSIIHGFKHKKETGRITVTVEKKENNLILIVEDNGCGMDAELIKKLLTPISAENNSTKVMGLENVIQRLYFFYPQNPAIIQISSKAGSFTRVEITIHTEETPCIPF